MSINSFANVRIRSTLPPKKRTSTCTLRPTVQPKPASARANAESAAFPSFSLRPVSTPIRRKRSACCARAASGHAAVLPSPLMNSRRRILDSLLLYGGAYCDPSCVGNRSHGRLWPEAADLGVAASRQLSGVHRTCCRRSRKGSP